MYLMQVKAPAESKGEWDLEDPVPVLSIAAEDAFRKPDPACSLVKN